MSDKIVLEGHLLLVEYDTYSEYRIAGRRLWEHLRDGPFEIEKTHDGIQAFDCEDYGKVRITIERLDE